MTISPRSWEATARRLFEDEYAVVMSGTRTQSDWRRDAVALMSGEREDAHTWATLGWEEVPRPSTGDEERYPPFVGLGTEKLSSELFEITREAAAQQLVAMTDEWFTVANISNFPAHEQELLGHASTLLARYGSHAEFHTSAPGARADPDLNFFEHPSAGYPFSACTMDLGLIAVSDADIGIFWRFNCV